MAPTSRADPSRRDTYIIRRSGLASAASVDEHGELWSAQKKVTGAPAAFAASSVASPRLVAVTLHVAHGHGHVMQRAKFPQPITQPRPPHAILQLGVNGTYNGPRSCGALDGVHQSIHYRGLRHCMTITGHRLRH
jgi:hypothetical protein